MTHKDFIAYLQKTCQIDSQQCSMLLNALCKLMAQAGVEQVPVTLQGLGTFISHKHPEYIEENPQTGLQTLYPPRITYRMQVEEEQDAIAGEMLDQQLSIVTKTSETETHRFIEALVHCILHTLEQGQEAEIHGFGSFRIVASHSADLQRIAYTPDKLMRDAVNAPFSCFEPLEIPYRLAPVSVESEKEEPVTPTDPVVTQETVEEENPEEERVEEEPLVVVTPLADDMPQVVDQKDEVEFELEEPISAEPEPNPVEENQPEETTEEEPKTDPIPTKKPRKRINKDSTLVQFLFAVLFLVFSCFCFYYCTSFNASGYKPLAGMEGPKVKNPQPMEMNDSLPNDTTVEMSIQEKPEEKVTLNTEAKPETKPEEKAQQEVKPDEKGRMKRPDGSYETYTLKRGDRLNLVAQKYYGDKNFWPYIFELNKDKLKTPDVVPVGVTLYIPDKNFFGIDPNNPQSVRKAKDKAGQLLRKK